ncbi:MAG: glycosyltransferase family 2 protein [Candidatus Bathyarchaeia archaeon]
MIDKIDLVMWTRNGAKTLPHVLKRIGQVVPSEHVASRIIVDDGSTDQTREIAQRFGWRVVQNRGSGISDGANTALDLVTTEWFASFEQDVLLSADWWPKIPSLLSRPEVAVASGLRFPSQPVGLMKLEEYQAERYSRGGTELDAETYGKTLDNTVYKTSVLRRLGGFPNPPVPAGIDTALNHMLKRSNLKWMVDYSVRSLHIREGFREELRHYFWYAQCVDVLSQIQTGKPYPLRNLYRRTLLSPARGLQIALKQKAPQIIYVYPLVRLAYLRGIAASRRRAAKAEKR